MLFFTANGPFKKGAKSRGRIGITFLGRSGTSPAVAIRKRIFLKFAGDAGRSLFWRMKTTAKNVVNGRHLVYNQSTLE